MTQAFFNFLQILDSRQLALKLIANVTYGYTAAGFSGRMPCAELADSIVQCGRSTLEKAISYVNTRDKWNARVIYGDTDRYYCTHIFVHFHLFLGVQHLKIPNLKEMVLSWNSACLSSLKDALWQSPSK